MRRLLPWLTLTLLLPSCSLDLSDDDGDASSGEINTSTPQRFESARSRLDALRSLVEEGDTYNLTDAGPRLFWDANSFGGGLTSYHVLEGTRSSYIIDTSTRDHTFDVSSALVVTTLDHSSELSIEAIPADGSAGRYTLDTLTARNSRVVYDVHDDVIAFLSEVEGVDTLQLWQPTLSETSSTALVPADLGWSGGDITELRLYGTRVLFGGNGFLALADTFDKTLQPIALPEGLEAILDMNANMAVVLSGGRLIAYDFEADTVIDVDAAVRDTRPLITDRPESQLPAERGLDAALYEDTVVYIGERGLFAYDTGSEQLSVLLLEAPENPREEFRSPRVTSDGTIFVDTLFSESASLGTSGPLYELPAELLR